MVLHMDVYQQSSRLSLYAPYWIINHTDLKLEYRVWNLFVYLLEFIFFYLDWK
jgi:hypothetical protein